MAIVRRGGSNRVSAAVLPTYIPLPIHPGMRKYMVAV